MLRGNLFIPGLLLFAVGSFLSFNVPWDSLFHGGTSNDSGAQIRLRPPSPVGPGVVQIELVTNQEMSAIPEPLVLVESDSSVTLMTLHGCVPGTLFTGKLEIDKNIADGLAYFTFLPDGTATDASQTTGLDIETGKFLTVDKTAPSQPKYLQATFIEDEEQAN